MIYPFVGLIEPGGDVPAEPDRGGRGRRAVAAGLVAGFERKRLIRRGVPIKTDTYTVERQLHLGRDGADRRDAAGAPRTAAASRAGLDALLDRHATMLPHSVHEPS